MKEERTQMTDHERLRYSASVKQKLTKETKTPSPDIFLVRGRRRFFETGDRFAAVGKVTLR